MAGAGCQGELQWGVACPACPELAEGELGYVPFTQAGAELLFEVVSRAYERTSLLVTTNLPFEAWVEVMGNERLTGALLDRLTHRIHILEANGDSYRLRESQRRLKQRTRPKTNEHNAWENLTPVAWRGISRPGAAPFARHPPRFSNDFHT